MNVEEHLFHVVENQLNKKVSVEILEKDPKYVLLRMTQEIGAKKLSRTNTDYRHIKTPYSAWDHFKKDYFPSWLLKWFPVNYKFHEYTVTKNYYINFPNVTKLNEAIQMTQDPEFTISIATDLDHYEEIE